MGLYARPTEIRHMAEHAKADLTLTEAIPLRVLRVGQRLSVRRGKFLDSIKRGAQLGNDAKPLLQAMTQAQRNKSDLLGQIRCQKVLNSLHAELTALQGELPAYIDDAREVGIIIEERS